MCCENRDRQQRNSPLTTLHPQRSTPHGNIAVRPLAPSRVHAAAAALTSAFAQDADPPTQEWLTGELAREAARYDADPTPWTRGSVHLPVPPWPGREEEEIKEERRRVSLPPPPPTLAIPSALRSFSSASDDAFFASTASSSDGDAHHHHPATIEWRVRVEEAWGRWLWLEASGDDGTPPPQLASCLGAAAILFHDRAASLTALAALKEAARVPLPPSAIASASAEAMDWGLWLRDAPPPAWPPRRAALLWWVGVPPTARRAGIGSALVAAAEAVAAGAGYGRVAVQANRVEGGAPTGVAGLFSSLAPPRARPRPAGRALYEACGYVAPPAPSMAAAQGSVDRSAVLLTKWCGGGGGEDDPWLEPWVK